MLSGPSDPRLQLALRMIKAWVRERFALAGDATVMTTQLNCTEPGCPPHETVIAFWDDTNARHQFKIVKAARDVSREDVWRLGDPALHPDPDHSHHDH
jgi:hypothetical protein